MPTLNSHTHYQVAPADAQAKTWQRVCLFQPYNGQTIKTREEHRTDNKRFAKKRVQCLNEALCFVSSSMLADSLVLRNPLLRQAPKRYASL